MIDMKRREVITLLGGATAWPLAVRAQHSPCRPLIGVLSPQPAAAAARNFDQSTRFWADPGPSRTT